MDTIGDKIRNYTIENRYGQKEFAKMLGFSMRALQTWERGERLPGYDGLMALADLMNVSTDWLMGRNSQR